MLPGYGSPQDLSDRTVLIVDDEDSTRYTLSRALSKLSPAKTLEAADGDQALATLNANPGVNVVFLDFNMPGQTGLEVLKAIRSGETAATHQLPVTMITSHMEAELVGLAFALDVNAFLVKPVKFADLTDRLPRLTAILAERPARDYGAVDIQAAYDIAAGLHAPGGGSQPISVANEKAVHLEDLPDWATVTRPVQTDRGNLVIPAGTRLSPSTRHRLIDLAELHKHIGKVWIDGDDLENTQR